MDADERKSTIDEFARAVNMTASQLRDWLASEDWGHNPWRR